jgi:hypothetical protein
VFFGTYVSSESLLALASPDLAVTGAPIRTFGILVRHIVFRRQICPGGPHWAEVLRTVCSREVSPAVTT